jgi:hypothetical protein
MVDGLRRLKTILSAYASLPSSSIGSRRCVGNGWPALEPCPVPTRSTRRRYFPVKTARRGRGGRIVRQLPSRRPCIHARARAPTKVHMMSTSWETSSSSSAYRSSSSSGLTMSLTCSYRSKIVGLVISRLDGARCRLIDLTNLVLVIPASAISAVAAAVRAGGTSWPFRGAGVAPRRRDCFDTSSSPDPHRIARRQS